MSWISSYKPPTVGTIYGELTVIEDYQVENKKTKDYLKVQCSCGTITEVQIDRLIRNITRSCGHLLTEFQKNQREMLINKPSKFEQMINKKGVLHNNYTLINYFESGRHNNIRLRNYTVECDCGMQYSKSDDINTPTAFSKTKVCVCNYSNVLTEGRIKNNYTLLDIANKFNVSESHVKIWENPAYDIEEKTLKQLYQLYNIPATYQHRHIKYRQHLGSILL